MKKLFAGVLVAMVVLNTTFAFADDVYATKNGKRYHKADCLLIKDKGAKMLSMEEAQKKALKPCHRCFGAAPAVAGETPNAELPVAK